MTEEISTPRLYLGRRRRGGHTVITAVGTIAQTTVIQLRTVLLQALARRDRSLLLDLAGVDHIDDAGLDALRRTAARAHLLGGQLRLVAPAPGVAARLRSSGLHHRVPVDATLTAALDTPTTMPAPGLETPDADRVEQHQPAEHADADDILEGGVDRDLLIAAADGAVDKKDHPTST